MFDFFWNLFSFIVALGILVTVHEYGHFWVARRCGVKVERFSVGFGKVLWRTTDKQGTEYVIALIPLGGYVKMLDERVDDVSHADKDKAFNNKSVYQRIAIIAAGPLANFAFAIIAFYLMFLIGVPNVKPIIGAVAPNSIVAQAGVQAGSEIISINDNSTQTWQDVNMALVASVGENKIAFQARLPETQFTKSYQLNLTQWPFSLAKGDLKQQSPISSLGLTPYRPKIYTEIAMVAKDSPAEKAGLKKGDKLLSIAQINIEDNWPKFADKIKQYANKSVSLTLLRDNQKLQLLVTPASKYFKGKKIGYLGVSPKRDNYPEHYKINQSYGIISAFSHSVDKTWQLVSLSFTMIGKLISGDVSVNNLSGPIAIAQGAGSSASYGFVYFLGFLALISVNLGIINLLPMPVLDGGHLFYYVIELITGKPVPEKIQELGFKFGALALLGLMSIAIYNDLLRL
ncbi:MAG: sigma E protease regulator RseP [Alteromonadaceae bacterium]|nr:sigma E protease regulator RseP [Alteromonadaceae bacterium]